jgi:hypothetical protein
LEANQAVSFFVKLENFRDDDDVSVQSLTLENGKTQEELVIKGQGHDYVTISRCPMGTKANEEECEEMSQHTNIHNRTIIFRPYPD